MSLRIAQLVNALPQDQVGGLQRYVGDLSTELARRGHRVTVITKRLHRDLAPIEDLAPNLRLVRTPTPERSDPGYALRYPLAAALESARVIRRGRFDVVHAHFALPGLGCRMAGRPYMYTFHAPVWAEVTEERGGRYRWPSLLDGAGAAGVRALERTAVTGADRHLVLSDFMAGQLRDLTGPGVASELVPGGIDTEWFSPGEPTSLTADPWFAADGPILFCARRLVPRMGVQNLVEAMVQIRSAHPGVRLAVAGTGFLEDDIRDQITDLGLTEAVRLLGRISDDALRDWYRRADLSVLPSAHLEGFGLSTAEAMACGTAVVGTPAGATPELLEQLDPTLICADTTPAALAVTITRTLDAPERLAELGSRARDVAVRAWSWQVVADRHETVYAQQVAGQP